MLGIARDVKMDGSIDRQTDRSLQEEEEEGVSGTD